MDSRNSHFPVKGALLIAGSRISQNAGTDSFSLEIMTHFRYYGISAKDDLVSTMCAYIFITSKWEFEHFIILKIWGLPSCRNFVC